MVVEGKVWVEQAVKLKDEELKMKCFKEQKLKRKQGNVVKKFVTEGS